VKVSLDVLVRPTKHAIFSDQPCYEIVIVQGFETFRQEIQVAVIHREKMSGCGINMWGSAYRWTIESRSRLNLGGESGGFRDGVFTVYVNTLRDAKEMVFTRIFNTLSSSLGLAVTETEEKS